MYLTINDDASFKNLATVVVPLTVIDSPPFLTYVKKINRRNIQKICCRSELLFFLFISSFCRHGFSVISLQLLFVR